LWDKIKHMDQDAVNKKNVKLIIIVAALGYFVDIYDLILFSVIRIKSLKGLGVCRRRFAGRRHHAD
jgi:hypothetical protein